MDFVTFTEGSFSAYEFTIVSINQNKHFFGLSDVEGYCRVCWETQANGTPLANRLALEQKHLLLGLRLVLLLKASNLLSLFGLQLLSRQLDISKLVFHLCIFLHKESLMVHHAEITTSFKASGIVSSPAVTR